MFKQYLNLTADECKAIFLSSLGSALEFYDFVVYLFFSNELSRLFFPHENHLVSLLGILSVFAIGYLVRPLGGIIFSHFGDRYGRKKTFTASIILMALPTFLIGILPTYQQLGSLAAILLIALRLLQGLSVGGEIPGSLVFAGEYVVSQHRALTCSLLFFGINLGIILGSAISALLTSLLSSVQLMNWGWRLPFILGGLSGIISYYLRTRLSETAVFSEFQNEKNKLRLPLIEVLKIYQRNILQSFCLVALGSVVPVLLFIYLPTYLTEVLDYPRAMITMLNTANNFLFSLMVLLIGWTSDRIKSRRSILIAGSGGFIVLAYGLFCLLSSMNVFALILAMLALSLLGSCITAVFTCTIIELFPTAVRYTGLAIPYNFGFAICAGLAPLIATYLIKLTNNVLAPSFYLMTVALLCFIASWSLKDSQHGKPFS